MGYVPCFWVCSFMPVNFELEKLQVYKRHVRFHITPMNIGIYDWDYNMTQVLYVKDEVLKHTFTQRIT